MAIEQLLEAGKTLEVDIPLVMENEIVSEFLFDESKFFDAKPLIAKMEGKLIYHDDVGDLVREIKEAKKTSIGKVNVRYFVKKTLALEKESISDRKSFSPLYKELKSLGFMIPKGGTIASRFTSQ